MLLFPHHMTKFPRWVAWRFCAACVPIKWSRPFSTSSPRAWMIDVSLSRLDSICPAHLETLQTRIGFHQVHNLQFSFSKRMISQWFFGGVFTYDGGTLLSNLFYLWPLQFNWKKKTRWLRSNVLIINRQKWHAFS